MVILKQKDIKTRPREQVFMVKQTYNNEGSSVSLFWDEKEAKRFFDKVVMDIKDDINEDYLEEEYITETEHSFYANYEAYPDDGCSVELGEIEVK